MSMVTDMAIMELCQTMLIDVDLAKLKISQNKSMDIVMVKIELSQCTFMWPNWNYVNGC